MPWVTALIGVPLLAALGMLALPEGDGRAARVLAIGATTLTLVLSAIMLGQFDRGRSGLQFVDSFDWASVAGLRWTVGVDGVSIWLVMLTTALFALAIVATAFEGCDRPRAWFGLLLLAEAALVGLFSAGDLVLFYVFWEGMLIPFYFLIGLWGGEGRGRATLQFVIYTMVGSLVMLVAIVATAVIAQRTTGQFDFTIANLTGVAFTDTQSTWLFAGFALAFAIKLPLWPFHAWLPPAYSAAPIAVTALLAAVMSKAGVYGLLRIGLPLFPAGADAFAGVLSGLAVIGIAYGSLLAWRAPTMRLLIAYSSLAHLGFIVLGIMAFDLVSAQGAVLQMVNHGVVVAAAFAIVGIIARGTRTESIDRLSGLGAGAPWLGGLFLVVTMAALAIPGSNAFVGEFFILTGVFQHHRWAAILACIGIVYAAVYMLRLYQDTMNGPRLTDGRASEIRPRDLVVLGPLIATMGLIALWPQAFVGATRASVAGVIAPAQAIAGRPVLAATPRSNPPRSNLPLPGDGPTTASPAP